ncbi:putative aquarius [Toxoplasma gondii FOU]|uniref:Putative aquarius n=1 Tax=Toxoplasma gondii FOU TaxID=943167 RepID=A0A086LHW3_TOXGO|nr:putative aquarius [Toxoplasma gondii FOU]
MQGRARPSLAALYSWNYRRLGNLPAVVESERYITANPGLSFDFQFINVEDHAGKGETSPLPYFYQNLGEAEAVVALYMYMRLTGYPAEAISILTTYNGQLALISDVLHQRCAWNPAIGLPKAVATVDKYQGMQNDYILLSLVRTERVGHIRDVRRLIVAVSRARLGLYVFGRWSLFGNCAETRPVMRNFAKRPLQLALQLDEESFFTTRTTLLFLLRLLPTRLFLLVRLRARQAKTGEAQDEKEEMKGSRSPEESKNGTEKKTHRQQAKKRRK